VTPTNSVGDDRFLRVTIDAEPVSEVLSRAPGVAYFWLRKFLFGAFVDHRLTWLRAKGTKFGRRGGADSKAIKVWPINQGPVPPGPADVVYQVQPAPERVASAAEAATQLPQLAAEAFTGNEAGHPDQDAARQPAAVARATPGREAPDPAQQAGQQAAGLRGAVRAPARPPAQGRAAGPQDAAAAALAADARDHAASDAAHVRDVGRSEGPPRRLLRPVRHPDGGADGQWPHCVTRS
jgi:hypothetical protein